MLLYRWDPTVYIVSMSYIKINYQLKFDAVKLYCLKGCVIMTSKQVGGGDVYPSRCGHTGSGCTRVPEGGLS